MTKLPKSVLLILMKVQRSTLPLAAGGLPLLAGLGHWQLGHETVWLLLATSSSAFGLKTEVEFVP